MSPISNDFVRPERLAAMEPFYPLHAYVCEHCWLVQLGEFQPAEKIFTDEYAYFSSYSASWLDHAREYSLKMIDRFDFDQRTYVVELASNDGYLLKNFKEQGIQVLGVEPSANVAQAAEEIGIPSLVKFFGVATAEEMTSDGIRADLLIGNNVLAHVPDLNDFVQGMKRLLSPHGVITMEFPHLMQLSRRSLTQFEQIRTVAPDMIPLLLNSDLTDDSSGSNRPAQRLLLGRFRSLSQWGARVFLVYASLRKLRGAQ